MIILNPKSDTDFSLMLQIPYNVNVAELLDFAEPYNATILSLTRRGSGYYVIMAFPDKNKMSEAYDYYLTINCFN